MKKGKYTLSEENVNLLTQRLMKAYHEGTTETVLNANITTDFIHKMTHVQNLTDVIDQNDKLSETYSGFLSLYGFNSMYDMYMYAKACEALPTSLTKSKDYSKLVPVKRKVMRNGKQVEVTVYEDPDKGGSQPNEGNTQAGSVPAATHAHARELKGKMHGKGKKLDTKDIAKLKQLSTDLPKGTKFNTASDYLLKLDDANGQLAGVIGYSIEDGYIRMDFYRSNGQVPGIATRGFSELIKLAMEKQKGVKVADDPQARPALIKFGLTQKGSEWSIEYKALKTNLGESWDKSVR